MTLVSIWSSQTTLNLLACLFYFSVANYNLPGSRGAQDAVERVCCQEACVTTPPPFFSWIALLINNRNISAPLCVSSRYKLGCFNIVWL